MSLVKYLKDKYTALSGDDKLATTAYGLNLIPYLPAIVLNTLNETFPGAEKTTANPSPEPGGFEGIAEGYSDFSTANFDPIPALLFGLVHVLDGRNPTVGNNKYVNLIRAGAGAFYGVSAAANIGTMFLIDPAAGDIVNAVSNGFMSAALLSSVNTSLNRRSEENNPATMEKDLEGVVEDIGKIRNFRNPAVANPGP